MCPYVYIVIIPCFSNQILLLDLSYDHFATLKKNTDISKEYVPTGKNYLNKHYLLSLINQAFHLVFRV